MARVFQNHVPHRRVAGWHMVEAVAQIQLGLVEAWGPLGHIFHGTARDQPHHQLNAFAARFAHVIDVRYVDGGFGVVDQVVQEGSVKFFVDLTGTRAFQLVTHATSAPYLHFQILIE